MQANTERRLQGLKDKIPDIQKTLDTVRFLKLRKVCLQRRLEHEGLSDDDSSHILQPDSEPLEATFELNDTLYAKANIASSQEVYLWLGVCLL